MRGYQLDPHQTVGGVIAEDADQQIVQLNLQKGNEVPPYSAEAIITITVLSGAVCLKTEQGQIDLQPMTLVRLEPQETHALVALEDNTSVLVVKQLCYHALLNQKLRFGRCCI